MSNLNFQRVIFSLASISFWRVFLVASLIIGGSGQNLTEETENNATSVESNPGPDVELLSIKFHTKENQSPSALKHIVQDSIIYNVSVTFKEMTFSCISSYPTSWKFHKPPFEDNSIQSIYIAKRRVVPQNLTDFDLKKDSQEFHSNLTITFKHFLEKELSPITCRGSKTAGFGKHSTVIEGIYCPHDRLKLTINISKYDDSKQFKDRRKFKIGVNKYCNVTLVIDAKRKQFACGTEEGPETERPRPAIISCRTKDECVSIYENDTRTCNHTTLYHTECNNSKHACFHFSDSPLPGVIRCSDSNDNSIARSFFTYPFTNNELGFEFWDTATAKLVLEILPDRKGSVKSEVYFGENVTFQCKASGSFFSNGLQWVLTTNASDSWNDSLPKVYLGNGEERLTEDNILIATKTIYLDKNYGNSLILTCFAPRWNRYNWSQESFAFNVSEPTKPEIISDSEAYCQHEDNIVSKPLNSNKPSVTNADACRSTGTGKLIASSTFVCKARGKPLPEIIWKVWDKSGNKVYESMKKDCGDEADIVSESRQTVGIMQSSQEQFVQSRLCVHLEINTEYTVVCNARSFFGDAKRTIECDGTKMNMFERALIIGLVVALLLTACGGIFAFMWMRGKAKSAALRLTQAEAKKFEVGDPYAEGAFALPYNEKKFEINIYEIKIDPENVLGMGQFGEVVRGTYKDQIVAIKMLKPNAELVHFKSLMSEIKLMCFMDKHPHLVNMVGAYTREKHKGNVFLVMEFCARGNLLNYLRKAQPCEIPYGRMIAWAYECSCAMEYLSLKNFIHKDIAARNILLTENLQAKIGDFGISKQLEDFKEEIYRQRTAVPLPLKWMAIESLQKLEFSTKSDVWSYGVLLWEIFSLGATPYPGLPQFDPDSYQLLLAGFRMNKPTDCRDEMYDLMRKCWEADPKRRPTFSEIRECLLTQFLKDDLEIRGNINAEVGGNNYVNYPK